MVRLCFYMRFQQGKCVENIISVHSKSHTCALNGGRKCGPPHYFVVPQVKTHWSQHQKREDIHHSPVLVPPSGASFFVPRSQLVGVDSGRRHSPHRRVSLWRTFLRF